MGIQKMSPKFKKRLNHITQNFKLFSNKFKLINQENGLIHFGEVRICNKKDLKNPIVILSIDKPDYKSKHYFVSGVHFYSADFSKLLPKFIIAVQYLVQSINTYMK